MYNVLKDIVKVCYQQHVVIELAAQSVKASVVRNVTPNFLTVLFTLFVDEFDVVELGHSLLFSIQWSIYYIMEPGRIINKRLTTTQF